MKWLKLQFRLLAMIDVLFAEKFVLETFKNNRSTGRTRFDSREFKNEEVLAEDKTCLSCAYVDSPYGTTCSGCTNLSSWEKQGVD